MILLHCVDLKTNKYLESITDFLKSCHIAKSFYCIQYTNLQLTQIFYVCYYLGVLSHNENL